jgi:hypothetical protein
MSANHHDAPAAPARRKVVMRPTASTLKRAAVIVPAAAALVAPLPAAASAHHPRAAAAGLTLSLGQSFGGLTAQGWPIAFGNNLMTTKIPWITVGLDLKCTSGGMDSERDGYTGLRVSKRGAFGASFGPKTQQFSDGTSVVAQGSMRGSLNKSRQKASGTWQLQLTWRDASGATADTCDSGAVHWRAAQ